jgi:hypothetical protein
MPGSPPPVGVGGGGTLTKRPANDPDNPDRTECERDQMELSMMDDAEYFRRGPSTGNQVQPADGRVFPRSDRLHLELEGQAGTPVWAGALLDRAGMKTAVAVTVGERTDVATGQRWLTADVTLAPLGVGDYVIELTSTLGTEQKRTVVPIRVTR